MQLAARLTDRAEPGRVLVSNVVRELCAGKTFELDLPMPPDLVPWVVGVQNYIRRRSRVR